MGIPQYEAKRYEGRIKEGGILVSVHCDNSEWVSRAKDLLKETGAEDISSRDEGISGLRKIRQAADPKQNHPNLKTGSFRINTEPAHLHEMCGCASAHRSTMLQKVNLVPGSIKNFNYFPERAINPK
jgi:hypothetical protein